jgi:hypothetical protein
MMTPPDNVDPLDSVNAVLAANVRQQKLLTESLRQPRANDKTAKLARIPFSFLKSCFTKTDQKTVNDFLAPKKFARVGALTEKDLKTRFDVEAGGSQPGDNGESVCACLRGTVVQYRIIE